LGITVLETALLPKPVPLEHIAVNTAPPL